MNKIMSIIMALLMMVTAIGNASAGVVFQGSEGMPETVVSKLETSAVTDEGFHLGADFHEILYGNSYVEHDGDTIEFSERGLVRVSDKNETRITATVGDNLNISGECLYYSVFENGTASVHAYDMVAEVEHELFKLGNDRIDNMYVINDSRIEMLAGNVIYRYSFDNEVLEKVGAPKDVFSFIPTEYGNIYATGSSVDATLVFMDKVIAKHVSYYSIEDGMLVVTVDGYTYQMEVSEIASRCENACTRGDASEVCPVDDMALYEFYGTERLSDVINLAADPCDECSDIEHCHETECEYPSETRAITDTAVSPNARQQTIITRASNAVNLTWTPKVSFTGWRDNIGTYTDNDFYANVQVTGLPYARPDHYWTISGFYPVYVGIENYGDGTASTLSNFQTRVANTSDPFNVAASTTSPNIQHGGYGPLYGLDCSRFVCYSWGYGSSIDHSTTGYDSDPYCYKVISKSTNGSFTLSDLALLLPGDALVRYNSHAILVTAIYKNSSGTVTRIEVMEEVNPKARQVIYGTSSNPITNLLSRLVSNDAGKPYQAYRLKETVAFNANLGTVSPLSISIVVGQTYGKFYNNALPIPSRDNYGFLGWFTKKTGGTQVMANTIVQSDSARTLYAHWEALPPVGSILVVGCNSIDCNRANILI